MRQYQVPQFITVEDKVIGPFTIKQFIYLGGGGFLLVIARMFLTAVLFYPFALIIGSFAAALAFLKINEQPFPAVVKNALFYFMRPRLYVWKKTPAKPRETPAETKEDAPKTIPKLSKSKLTDLAWSLDVKTRHDHL